MSETYTTGHCKIVDSHGNTKIIYPITTDEAIKVDPKVKSPNGGTVNKLVDLLVELKSAAYKDVNDIIDPESNVGEGTASTERTYSMVSINKAFSSIKTNITEIQTKVSSIKDNETTVTEISKSLSTLTTKIDTIEKALSTATTQITSLNDAITKNKSTINTLNSSLKEATLNIEKLQTEVSSLKKNLLH